MILLGLDPGLGTTGWGVIAAVGNRLSHIANGQIKTDSIILLDSFDGELVFRNQTELAG